MNKQNTSDEDGVSQSPPTSFERMIEDENGTPNYVGPSVASSFLSEASESIQNFRSRNEGLGGTSHAAVGSLSDLSHAFAAVGFNDGIKRQVRKMRREGDRFYIPTQPEGTRVVALFLEIIDLGAPFFARPPPELLPKLAFEPSTVEERGWVLLFNCTISTTLALQEDPGPDAELALKYRWNTWVSLEESTLFLEPSIVKIQALVLLACHGQEFSTPGLCWTLMSHACRMSQALGLHTAAYTDSEKTEGAQQRRLLFWSLYTVDKNLSLAFGRPPFLADRCYQGLAFPDPSELATYRPHVRRGSRLSGKNCESGFGALHVLQSYKLALIIGTITETLYSSNATMNGLGWVDQQALNERKAELDVWRVQAFKVGNRSCPLPSCGVHPNLKSRHYRSSTVARISR